MTRPASPSSTGTGSSRSFARPGRSPCWSGSSAPSSRKAPPLSRTPAGRRMVCPTPSTRIRTRTAAAPSRSCTTASSRTPARCARHSASAGMCSGRRPTPKSCRISSKRHTPKARAWWTPPPQRCARWRGRTVSRWSPAASPIRSSPRAAAPRCWSPSATAKTSSRPTRRPCSRTRGRWCTWTMATSRKSNQPTIGSRISRPRRRKKRSCRWSGISPRSSAAATPTSCSRRSWSSPRASATRCAGACWKKRGPSGSAD